MSDAYLTRRGGGGGGSDAYAVIGVTYPEGSACTCSDGIKTLRAKDTSGSVLFYIPYAGDWTVTAASGEETKSMVVSVTEANQVFDVDLTNTNFFLANSYHIVENDDTKTMQEYSVHEATPLEPYFEAVCRYVNPSNQGLVTILFDSLIDLTRISTIEIVVGYLGVVNTKYCLKLAVSRNLIPKGTWIDASSTAAIKLVQQTVAESTTFSLDVSGLTGNHYLYIVCMSSYNPIATVRTRIEDIVLVEDSQ